MGARILVFDAYNQKHFPNLATELGFEYASFTKVLKESDFISLHAPLLPSTTHLIDKDAVKMMKKGVILVNTARGELIDIPGVLYGLKKGIIRGLASDVLEREEGRFYQDISNEANEYKKNDPEWEELISNENVIITSHQAFLTDVALTQIAKITLENADMAQNKDFSKALVIMENGKVKNG
nr:NAD(P)-dependent oxidoreductase [Mycoplasmopsis fermentans]